MPLNSLFFLLHFEYILTVYSPFSDRVGLPLHNIHNPSPFTSIMDIFFVDLKFGHIHFYTLNAFIVVGKCVRNRFAISKGKL